MKQRKSTAICYLPVSIVAGILALSSTATAQEFSYNGDNGPGYWSELSSDWSACAASSSDAAQSPINITKVKRDKSLKKLDLDTYPTTIDIFNNGHTIEQHYEDTGSRVYFKGVEYELKQFHFHTLSEHVVSGQHALMEMHLVFAEDGGTNLVIGQLFQKGGHNNFIQELIDAGLPEKDGDATETEELINVGDGLTNTNSYYTYSGSLTTPPCSEVVTWVVLQKPAKISADQFEAFRHILGNNFRPIQDLNGRQVTATKSH
jgi:carbonic anhydrase